MVDHGIASCSQLECNKQHNQMVSGLLTALLDALYGSTRDCPVDSLCGILDGLDGALARDGGGAEQASLAGDLGAEHGDGDVCGLCGLVGEIGSSRVSIAKIVD
jgi:hypothetical protein